MNTQTLIASLAMAAVLALLSFLLIRAMIRGWLRRGERQAALIGELPEVPDDPGPVMIEPANGLYVARTYAYVASGSHGLTIVDVEKRW